MWNYEVLPKDRIETIQAQGVHSVWIQAGDFHLASVSRLCKYIVDSLINQQTRQAQYSVTVIWLNLVSLSLVWNSQSIEFLGDEAIQQQLGESCGTICDEEVMNLSAYLTYRKR